MSDEEALQSAFEYLIQKTDQAIEEGWIYSEEYQEVLRSSKKLLPDQKEEEFKYPDSGNGFHVIQQ